MESFVSLRCKMHKKRKEQLFLTEFIKPSFLLEETDTCLGLQFSLDTIFRELRRVQNFPDLWPCTSCGGMT